MPPRIVDLEWDDWNLEHIARHGVAREEVEEVCFGEPWIQRVVQDNKRPVLGQTAAGRYLFVILADLGGSVFYPVTAREMTLVERRRYQRQRGR